jgi:predicted PurR-regulated permease PerM
MNFMNQSRALFWILAGSCLAAAALMLAPFLSAILWATVLSILLWPFFERLRKKMSEGAASAIVTIFAALVIVGPFATIATLLGVQALAIGHDILEIRPPGEDKVTLTTLAEYAQGAIGPVLKNAGIDFNIKDWVEQNGRDAARGALGPAVRAVGTLAVNIVSMAIALFTMFFMLRDGRRALEPACAIIPLPREKTIAILERIRNTVQSVFIGIVLVSCIQGAIATIAYAALGVPGWFIWGVVTVILCTIPLLGAPIVYIPLAIRLFAENKLWQGAVLLIIGFGVISQIDNILRPFFISKGAQMHEMVVFFSLLGGVLLFGPIGIMAGPMLMATLIGLADVFREMRTQEEEPVAAPAA